jgi:hypothetical protein
VSTIEEDKPGTYGNATLSESSGLGNARPWLEFKEKIEYIECEVKLNLNWLLWSAYCGVEHINVEQSDVYSS